MLKEISFIRLNKFQTLLVNVILCIFAQITFFVFYFFLIRHGNIYQLLTLLPFALSVQLFLYPLGYKLG